jgi:MFS family permease
MIANNRSDHDGDDPPGPPGDHDPARRGRLRRVMADIEPLRASRDFRLVFASRTVTLFGSQASEVALLVQARQLTGSAVAVGLLGAVELVPLAVFGLYGGALADRLDRRRLIRWCEAGLGCCAALLLANASLPHPQAWPLYLIAAAMMALAALQRPSLDASVPRVVTRDQLTAAAALQSLSMNASVITGTALGGVLATWPGPQAVYVLDTVSFAVSLGFLGRLGPLPAPEADGDASVGGLRSLLSGIGYARRRPELIGSYLIDLAAMTFAFPNALFPFMAAELHAPWAAGLMFAAPSAGAVAASATSGWTGRVHRHGRAIALAAAGWGLAITGFGLAPDIAAALALLVLAGGADMLSGIFRETLWNQTIPDSMRGRLAGVELLSYGLGPSAGQIRAGGVASITSPRFSLWSGGLVCVGAVAVTCTALPGFLAYSARRAAGSTGPASEEPGGREPGSTDPASTGPGDADPGSTGLASKEPESAGPPE